jgi:VWFA-related protein
MRFALVAPPAVLLAALLTAGPATQSRNDTTPAAEAFRVSVDLVVHDRKGRPVTDLTLADFEVLEDGVTQRVDQFAVFAPEASVPTAPPSPVAPSPAGNEDGAPAAGQSQAPTTIALVFDRLSTEGRVAAQKAAHQYLVEKRRPSDVIGVFSVEGTLVVLQDFTSDDDALAAAVDAVAVRAGHAGAPLVDLYRASASRSAAASAAMGAYLSTPTPRDAASGTAKAALGMIATRLGFAQRMAEVFEQLQRDASGYATSHALTAIIDALGAVEGRKAIVLFSEGLFKTDATEARFLSVVHGATRSGVGVYAVDASGLHVETFESATRTQLNAAAALSREAVVSAESGEVGPLMTSLERTADMVRFNPQASLKWISDQTGGFFVRDTNDLAGALDRIGSDVRFYYLLGYTPSNEVFDGRFRKIEVKTKRKDLRVRARSGYFAVRSEGAVLAHVAPALALLENGQRPHAFPLFARAIPFPEAEGPARVSVVATVPIEGLSGLAGRKRNFALDLTLLARIRDARGEPVEALSRRVALTRDELSEATGICHLLRDTWLPAGRYTVEIAAQEANSDAASVVVGELEVPVAARGLDQVQVILVRGAAPPEDAGPDLTEEHPLRFGEVVVFPGAGEPLPVRSGKAPLYQVIVPATAEVRELVGRTEVWRGDDLLGAGALVWQAPDHGWQRHVAELPAADLAPGTYELRVLVSDGSHERILSLPFEVAGSVGGE